MKAHTKSRRNRSISHKTISRLRALVEAIEPRIFLSTSPTLIDLADFGGTSNGRLPYGSLVMNSSGNLYGTANSGGASNIGTVFELAAGSSSITKLGSFNTTNGRYPDAGLIMDTSGNLYGATSAGGASGNHGVVFEVHAGTSSITVLASFNGTNGQGPTDSLTMDSSGDLYGTTSAGGANSDGTVFELAAASSTITVLASFNGTNGSTPKGGLLLDSGGDLYGTTFTAGADSSGTIFEVAAGSSSITTLANFTAAPAANNPTDSLIMDSSGNLYGTSSNGGANSSYGTVFELAAGSTSITTLASFNVTDGSDPVGGLIMDASGDLYGTTERGGANNLGTVFGLAAGSSTITTLATFNAAATGPQSSLIMDTSGNLYGLEPYGGANNDGFVFEVIPASSTQTAITAQPTIVTAGSSQSISVSLESFAGTLDTTNQSTVTLSIASGPSGATLGGTLSVSAVNGIATFSGLTFDEAGTYTLTAASTGLTSATTTSITVNPADAAQLAFAQQPTTAAAYHTTGTIAVDVEDAYGNIVTSDISTVALSTTTTLSGTFSVSAVAGVATFNDMWIATTGSYTLSAGDGNLTSATSSAINVLPRGYTLTELADFGSGSPDAIPAGNLIADSNGDLFGTTDQGGDSNSDGAVFEIPAGTTSIVTVALFNSSTGQNPDAGLVMDSSANLYGTTYEGGDNGDGTVFEVAAASSTITTLVSFDQSTGEVSAANLLMDSSGNLFGTTLYGGANNDGTVFEIAAGTTSLTVIASFNQSTGYQPEAGLIMDTSGNLFGTTFLGGANQGGSVFEIAAGSTTITDLADFTDSSGADPTSALVMDSNGNLYGTDAYAGAHDDGAVFELAAGSTTITGLASFNSSTGYSPLAGLVMDSDGNLYGTAQLGGANGFGTVFEYSAGTINVLASFTSPVGQYPDGSLLMDSSGNLYGLASEGGTDNAGTAFEAAPSSSTQAAITAQPTTVTAGTSQSITVDLESLDGTLDTTNQQPVTLSIDTGPTGASIGGTLTVDAVNGVADFTGLTFDIAGNYTITASADGLVSAATSTITVNATTALKLAFAEQPASAMAGQSLGTVAVDVEDTYGNLVTADTSMVSLSTSTTLGGTTSVAAIGGIATFTDLSVDPIGMYTLSAMDGSLTATTSNSFTITPAAAAQLAFDLQPGSATAGQTIGTISVDVEDAYGNIVTGDDSLVTLSTTVSIYGTDGMQAVSGVATLSGLSIHTAGDYLLSASDGTLTPATSDSITITAATAAKLAFDEQPASATAGQSIGTVSVDVEDMYGNLVKTDSSMVTVSALPTVYGTTTEQAVDGVATFADLSVDDAISLRLTASDGNLTSGQSNSFTITDASASQLVVHQQPTGAAADQTIGTFVLYVEDPYGNVVGTDTSMVTLSTNAPIYGTKTVNVMGGVASFSDFWIDVAGNHTLTASDGSLASATSDSITITPGAAHQLAFGQQPTSATAYHTMPAIAVDVEDQYGNVVTSDTSTVMLSSTTPLSGTTSAPAVAGVATFDDLWIAATGNFRLSAADGSLSSAMSAFIAVAQPPVPGLTLLASFNNSTGLRPLAGLIMDSSGDLFGTTDQGPGPNDGTVFEIPAATTTIVNLAVFTNSSTGEYPSAGLVIDSSGDLFGTTQGGGANDDGTVFEIPAGATTINTLVSFNNATGYVPDAALVMDSSGDLFGTTIFGGANSDGTAFEIPAGTTTLNPVISFNAATGYHPADSLVIDSSGNLYGTGFEGGANSDGSIFEIPAGSTTVTNLASFSNGVGIDVVSSLVMDSSGNLYGTAQQGGANNDGTLFELASGASTITPLFSFNSATGFDSVAGLVIDSAGNLYGTAEDGGANSDGTVFEYSGGTLTVLGSFSNSVGEYPQAGLLTGPSGLFYGTASYGGTNGYGTVFELANPSTAQAVFTTQPTTVTAGATQSLSVSLESSSGAIDTTNQSPVTLSIQSGPTDATIGGTLTVDAVNGVASFTGLTFDTTGAYTLQASSAGVQDFSATITVTPGAAYQLAFAEQPTTATAYHTMPAIIVAVEDQYGNVVTGDTSTVTLSSTTTLSGTTSVAALAGVATFGDVWIGATGNYTLSAGDAGLMSATSNSIVVAPSGYAVTALASFTSNSGISPYDGLIADSSGNLYGTTEQGGPGGVGTVFEVAAGSSTITKLAAFNSMTGQYPAGGLVMDSSGDLFGTTQFGGTSNYGTVFEVAAGSSTITTIALLNTSTTGNEPAAGLVMDSSGDLFGTATYGGANSDGTVFEVAGASHTITAFASFNSSTGSFPIGGLFLDSDGNLYGTTISGGANGQGTVFEIASGSTSIGTLASFNTSTGIQPESSLIMDSDGNLYGTAESGGAHAHGTLFELAAASTTITPLVSLSTSTGYVPVAGLNMDSQGHLYGTAELGGANGDGTVFEYSAGTLTVLASLTSSIAKYPFGGLLLGPSGTLYGTSIAGGANGLGAVFEATPSSTAQAAVTAQPTTVTADTSQSISVDLESFAGTLDTTNQAPVTLSIESGPTGATIGGTLTVDAVNGVADFSGLTLDMAGTYTLTVSSAGVSSADTSAITVNAAAASQLAFAQQPAAALAGQSLGTVTVDVEDPYGNLVTTDTSMVSLSASTVLGGATSEAAVGGVATFTNLSVDLAGTYTLSAADGSLTSATSNSFTITPAAAAKLVFDQQPAGAVAGQTIGTVSVDVEDAYGNLITSDASTVSITTADSTPLGGTTSVSAVGGVASFTGLSITLAGAYSLSATDNALPSGASDSFTITPASATHLGFAEQPGDAVAGQTPGTVTVDVLDTYGNLVTTDTSSVTLATSDGAPLSGTTSVPAIGGVATFTGLSVTGAGARSLSATDNALTSTTSSSFTVSPAAASELVFAQQPTGAAAGQTLGTITVDIDDAYGNLATADTSTVTLAAGDAPVSGTNSVSVVGGVATFTGLSITLAGTHTLSATDGSLSSATSNSFAISAAPAAKLVVVQQPTSATSGQPLGTLAMEVEDTYGNLVVASPSNVTVTAETAGSTTASSALAGTTTVATHNGVAVFSDLMISTGGDYTLTAADAGLTDATTAPIAVATSAPATVVTAGVQAAPLMVNTTTAFPQSDKPSRRLTVRIENESAGGKTVQTKTVPVKNGQAMINHIKLHTAGIYNVVITNAAGHSTTEQITIVASAPAKLAFVSEPTTLNGQSPISVRVLDQFGNLATAADGATVALHLAPQSTLAHDPTLTGTVTATIVNGLATFPDVSVDAIGRGRLIATSGKLLKAISTVFNNTEVSAGRPWHSLT